MFKLRRADARGQADHGWLRSAHTFSFANFYDPQHMGYRSLRVLNEDWVAPRRGFPPHPHRDMEIITWVISGAVAHEDNMGNREVLRANEVQRMRAGRGVVHSEVNPSADETLHLLQIWILPQEGGLDPTYDQRPVPVEERRGRWVPLVTPEGSEGSFDIAQDASLSIRRFLPDESDTITALPGRGTWVHVVTGAFQLDDTLLNPGDAFALEGERRALTCVEEGDLLCFDLG